KLAAVDEVTDLPPPTLALMAQVLRGLGARDQSLALLTKAQQRHPGDFWVNYDLAILLETMGPTSTDDVIRYSAMALALRPQSPAAHFKLGRALLVKGRLDEGIAELRESIRLQASALAGLVLGQALVNKSHLDEAPDRKGLLGEAVAHFERAIDLKKDYADAHTNLGDALNEQGKLDEAIVKFRLAIGIKDDAYPHIGLGSAFYHKGSMNEAIAEY